MTQLLEYLQTSADDQRKKDILRRYEGLLAFQRERFNMSILERKELVGSFFNELGIEGYSQGLFLYSIGMDSTYAEQTYSYWRLSSPNAQ
jgi:hypothetical protein